MSAEGIKEDTFHLLQRSGFYDLLCNLIVYCYLGDSTSKIIVAD